jgi:CTP:molybdopterin cytidylyltransferase MocA
VAALPTDAGAVLLLAGDQPFVAEAVPLLLAALADDDAHDAGVHDGVRAVDAAGRAQHLTSLIRRPALVAAIATAAGPGGSLDGVAMRRLLEPLRLRDVEVPQAATMDVDTWADAKAVGATGGEGS